ncbi:ABC transporter substrate-binding protein [Saccharothrix deserti]|uniref:ABC transporter substrate-binding protein n=1 Tax=Saccharothrix deserti TaxID=2593674 RepID=UPI00131BF267|nr:ABC transporter substrate-binding protein [Saccharothrix deserti]
MSGPPTLDPYKANLDPNSAANINLGYAALIRMNPDRTFTGDLAESFGYTDKQNKVFQLKLRADVKFADGTPVDAAAVVASLEYFRKVGVNAASWGGSISSITAPDSSTVVITNSTSNPVMPMLMSQALLSGSIISPAGLADPGKLAQQTFGAGPYTLDPANTVPNDHYTYTANPNYWNKAQQRWKRVVVRIIPDANATVQAIQANQVDAAAVGPDAGPALTAAGLQHVKAGTALMGMVLADRDGAVAAPLKDARVRQALNYAIDRAAVTKAIFGDFAEPTSQTSIPGYDGYSEALDGRYPYDPDQAKSLLSAAGYPNGFTLIVETQGFFGINIVTQAVIAQWKKIGVNVELTTDAQPPQWIANVMARKFPVTGFGYGALPTYLSSQNFMLPTANPFNPFGTGDDQLNQLLAQAAAEPDPAKQAAAYQQATTRLSEVAWFAPVARVAGILVVGKRLANIDQPGGGNLPDVLSLRPSA